MMKATRWWCLGLVITGAILCSQAGKSPAQDKKDEKKKKEIAPHEKHDGSALNDSLRDVINTGVKMFNDQGDHAGCYRLFQGSLLSVRPFLAGDLQKKIDEGITNAEKMRSYADRAFELRRVIDEIRSSTPTGDKKDKKKETKKTDEPASDKGQVSGRLIFQGKPVTGGYFVTLIGGDSKKFSSAIQKDGSFQFKTPIPLGEYRVAIEPIPGEAVKGVALPPRYASEGTSGLSIRVQAGKQQVDLNLVK